MVACDNEDCSIEWFHTECLQIMCQRVNGIVQTVSNFQSLDENGHLNQQNKVDVMERMHCVVYINLYPVSDCFIVFEETVLFKWHNRVTNVT
jgi:hypothetical protein